MEGKEKENNQTDGVDGTDDVQTNTKNNNDESKITKEERQNRPVVIPSLIQHNDFHFPGVPASPPKFVSVEQIMQAADVFSNMALAHEIAVNKEFVLEKMKDETNLEKQVKEVVHKAFWDVFQAQLQENPPDYSHALLLLGEIKENLTSLLLPYQNRIRSQIDEVLDLDLIKQQVENDALDFHYYARFILATMFRLCAPVRDEKIQELMALNDIVPLYKGILETLDLMKLDMANFTLQQMRPHIQQHSVEYERKKFQEFLSALQKLSPPVDGLELTRKWLNDVYKKLLNDDDDGSASSSSTSCCQKISNTQLIIKAYLELLLWENEGTFPESLRMDEGRFFSLRDQFIVIVLAASILLVTYSIVGEAIQGVSSLKVKLKDQLFVLLQDVSSSSCKELPSKLEAISLQVIKEVNECLTEHGYSVLNESKVSLLSMQIKEIQSENHSVKKLIKTRILEFAEQLLKSTNATSVKFPAGLSAFHKELSSLSGQFLQLVNHNRAVFSDFYADIIADIQAQQKPLCELPEQK